LIGVRLIWVDALRINQQDAQEKSLQIRQMKDIYSKAEDVHSCIGREANNSREVIRFLEGLVPLSRQDMPRPNT
jgi:hypothetical protein